MTFRAYVLKLINPAPRTGFQAFMWGYGIKTERDFAPGLFLLTMGAVIFIYSIAR